MQRWWYYTDQICRLFVCRPVPCDALYNIKTLVNMMLNADQADQLLWSLALVEVVLKVEAVLVEAEALLCDVANWLGSVPSVQTHSRLLFLRPATGVSGQASLSDSEDESRLSPV
jgi:hypothetical protein